MGNIVPTSSVRLKRGLLLLGGFQRFAMYRGHPMRQDAVGIVYHSFTGGYTACLKMTHVARRAEEADMEPIRAILEGGSSD